MELILDFLLVYKGISYIDNRFMTNVRQTFVNCHKPWFLGPAVLFEKLCSKEFIDTKETYLLRFRGFPTFCHQ